QEPIHIPDVAKEERFPQAKEWTEKIGLNIGSIVLVPLTTPHRRLGTFGIASEHPNTYSDEDVRFLRMIARVVASASDDGLNLRSARAGQGELKRNHDRLQLLLSLTNRITSNLELRELLRAIAANIREVARADYVGVSLPDKASGKHKMYALDFPQSKGLFREELLVTLPGAVKRALEDLKPLIVNSVTRDDFPPEVYEIAMAEGVKSRCCIPLVHRGRKLGVLMIGRTTERSFTSTDVEFFNQAAGQIAIAIENALAYQEISELKDKLAQEKLYLEEEIRSEMGFEEIIGRSAALKHVLQLVE